MSNQAGSSKDGCRKERRRFLKSTALAGGAAVVTPYFAWAKPAFANRSKNDRPIAGCIGVGSMGTGDARGINNYADIVAVCDVDSKHAAGAKADPNIGKGTAEAYGDYLKVLERDDIRILHSVNVGRPEVQVGKSKFAKRMKELGRDLAGEGNVIATKKRFLDGLLGSKRSAGRSEDGAK